jgi:hypothetical protein
MNYLILEDKHEQELKLEKKRQILEKEANKNKKKTEKEIIEEKLRDLAAAEERRNYTEVVKIDLIPSENDLKLEPAKDPLLARIKDKVE